MSFDIFFQAFADGDGSVGNGDAAAAVLRPVTTVRDGSFARIVTSDGGADMFGVDALDQGVMINHASGLVVWDVMYELARVGGYAIMPVGCPTCVTSEDGLCDLPEGLGDDAKVISSGADLLSVIRSA